MECSVLDMIYRLDLSLLEVIFVYMVKMSQRERFSLDAHISSLHLVTGLPDSNKGEAKGHVLVSDPWSGLYEGSNRVFYPQRSLKILSRICPCNLCSSFAVVFSFL